MNNILVNLNKIEAEAMKLVNEGVPTDEIQSRYQFRLVFHRDRKTGKVERVTATIAPN